MKTYKYIGLFEDDNGDNYTLEVKCFGVLQAFFLLTADAIRSARDYQLITITDEEGDVTKINDILNFREHIFLD